MLVGGTAALLPQFNYIRESKKPSFWFWINDWIGIFYSHLLMGVDMLSDCGASPTAMGGFEYGTGVAVRTTAIMSRSDIPEVNTFFFLVGLC